MMQFWDAVSLATLVLMVAGAAAFPDQGKWDFVMSKGNPDVYVPKSMLAGSEIYVQITCATTNLETIDVEIKWILTPKLCLPEQSDNDDPENSLPILSNEPKPVVSKPEQYLCGHDNHLILKPFIFNHKSPAVDVLPADAKPVESIAADAVPAAVANKPETAAPAIQTAPLSDTAKAKREVKQMNPGSSGEYPVFTITQDGQYTFSLSITPVNDLANANDFTANVHIEMRSSYGYLSAADYPLLPFYGAMCLVYLAFGIIWLIVSFMQWRDLLRIQFWIGGVILLGMLEKAMFYAEYQSINSNGVSVRGAVLAAEWVSCAKRSLARMLVVIVSLGFGIVKPRLGAMLHRVVGTGALYFVLACVEGYLRVMHTKNDVTSPILVASIPLAVLDSAICWWIFTSLVQTTRTLRLRRNTVKLALYRHFTNTLIFAVLASVVFMLYSIKSHRFAICLANWKELWQDEAFWHLLFSTLLLVIMILWRPTINNMRYAFTPLLDNAEDEDDDDEEDQFISDAYGVKMRGQRSASPKPAASRATTNEEDDLRWVEENIPQAIVDAALPVLDSDEEIVNTKFEVSKMQ